MAQANEPSVVIDDLLSIDDIRTGFRASGKKAVIQRLCEAAAKDLERDAAEIFDAVMDREQLGSTGVGSGVAIPHARLEGLDRPRGWFARLDAPVDYDAIDDAPVDLVFLLLAPEAANAEHLKTLARISRFFRREERRERIRKTDNAAAIHALFAATEKRDAA